MTMGWLCDKLRLVIKLIRLIDIEPYVILFMMTYTSDVARTQLMQDKICSNKYGMDRKYCIELSKSEDHEDSDEDEEDISNKILAEAAQYVTWTTLISSLPAIVFILFIASWIDTYVHGRKIVLLFVAVGTVANHLLFLLNSYYFEWGFCLWSNVPLALVGGWSCAWMTVYSFMSNNSSKENRFLKFSAFEVSTMIGRPLGTYLTGVLLGSGNYGPDGNMHHFERCFIFHISLGVAAFLYVLFFINENKPKSKTTEDNNNEIRKEKSEESKQMSHKFEFSKMFDIKNIRDMFITAFKVRPNRGRGKIWLLYLCMCFTLLADAKIFSILFIFTESVYGWDATVFSNVKSLASIFMALAMPVASGVLSGYMKLTDTKLGIIGFIITSLQDICIGSIVHPLGLYLLFIIGSITSLASLGVRSLVSKIAPESESGKLFALMGALELGFLAIENLVLNTIFNFSIDFFPSLLFQIAAALNFIVIFIFYWFDLTHDHNYTSQ